MRFLIQLLLNLKVSRLIGGYFDGDFANTKLLQLEVKAIARWFTCLQWVNFENCG